MCGMPPSNPDQQSPQQPQPVQPVAPPSQMPGSVSSPEQQPAPTPYANNYDFIVNPTEKPKKKPFQNTGLPVKIAILGGGIIVLLIVFNIFRGIISGPSIGEKFLTIAQDQQQIITVATAASQQQGLSTVNANSAITTQLGVSTDQADTIQYMANNGKKAKTKDLSLMLDSKLTAQLEASAQAGTYNETYKTVMTQQLNAYMNNMAQLYKQIDGKKGKALLDSNYKSAKLLLQQIEAS